MIGQGNTMKIFIKNFFYTVAVGTVLSTVFVATVSAVTFSAAVAQQQVYEGDSFVVEWFVDTEQETFNVLDAVVSYSTETLAVVDLSTASSAVVLWVQEPRVSSVGSIAFTGGVPAGVIGSRVPLMRTVFRATSSGTAAITLSTPAQALLSDGYATVTPITMKPFIFEVLPKQSVSHSIRSATHPVEDMWYKNNQVEITFDARAGEDYSYSFSTNPELIPDAKPDTHGDTIVYDAMPDGVYYFTLASRAGEGTWQEARVFRVQIDTTAPEFIDAQVVYDTDIFSGAAFATFVAVDKTSGIDEYKIKSGWFGMYTTAVAPYKLKRPIIGDTTYIRAIDTAGNSETATVYLRGYISPWIAFVGILLVLIISSIVVRRQRS